MCFNLKSFVLMVWLLVISGLPSHADVFHNPIIAKSLPDPTVIHADDGFFYLYATEDTRNVPIYRSPDMLEWEFAGTCFTDSTRPKWNPKGGIWAPDINRIDGRYVLYYAKSEWGGVWSCGIGVATSDKPEGPFTDHGPLFISKEIGVENSIDAEYVEEDGHKYLFWGSFRGIYYIELTQDGLSLKDGSKPTKVAGDFMEGTYVHRHGGYYYLFGSSGTCCEREKSTYHVTVGRSKSLFGPYNDKQGRPLTENYYEVMIHGSDAVAGPGHNGEILTDGNGADWIVYHGYSRKNPRGGRMTFLDRVVWIDDWPYVANNRPSTVSTRPHFRSSQSAFHKVGSKKSRKKSKAAGNTDFESVPDTVSVIHNPCTGWSIYTDGYIPQADKYYKDMEDCGALAYASSLYIRLPWALLEPEEGKYAWIYNEEFKKLIQGAKDRHLKLAFRVYYDNKDYRIPISPRYLIDAGADGYESNTGFWTPYADDPVFLSKLDKFLEEMGKEFNDPAITDYVDGCGLGTWGEGFNAVYKDKEQNKDKVLLTVARSYARHFSRVIVCINAHSDMGIKPLRTLADEDDIVFRHDAIGSRVWFEPSQSKLMQDYFPQHFTIAESMWWLSQGPHTDLYKNEDFRDWRDVMEFTYAEAKRIRANVLDLRNVPEASTLWMPQAKDLVDSFNRHAGYRLTPVKVSFPKAFRAQQDILISHRWRNSGWGVCPNNNTHWNFKYKVAFALLPMDSDEPVEIQTDPNAEPSVWLQEKDTPYTFRCHFSAQPGQYRIAVGIIDTSKENTIGLKLAVSDKPLTAEGWLPMGSVEIRK